MGDIVPRKTLVKQGMQGLGGVGGGLGLIILNNIASGAGLSVPGLIVGGILTLGGLAVSSSKDDRTAGLIAAGAGAATVIASLPVIGGIAGSLMFLGGVGLIAAGGVSLFRFVKGMRKNAR